jgi:acetyl-CoA carboxylase carboxyl transferase subunit alpha
VVIGEGGSGGAIAIGFGDRILMLENAFYSVISPEGCAAILWHTKDKAEEAAKALRLSAIQLKKLGIIDEVIKEPEEGAHKDIEKMAKSLKEAILYHLQEISAIPKEELILLRKKRFDNFSKFFSYSPK